MSEWLKEHAWKACVGETLPWVRIPLSPPVPRSVRFDEHVERLTVCGVKTSAIKRAVRNQHFEQPGLLAGIASNEQIMGVFREFSNLRPGHRVILARPFVAARLPTNVLQLPLPFLRPPPEIIRDVAGEAIVVRAIELGLRGEIPLLPHGREKQTISPSGDARALGCEFAPRRSLINRAPEQPDEMERNPVYPTFPPRATMDSGSRSTSPPVSRQH